MSIFPAVSNKQTPWQKTKLAMAFGESRHYRPKDITRRHFEETAKQAGFPTKELTKIIEAKATLLDPFEQKIKLPVKFPEEVFSSVIQGAKKQAQRLQ